MCGFVIVILVIGFAAQGEFQDCGSLTTPADGSIAYSSGTKYQSVATFSCNIGYTLDGDATRTCQANSLWSTSNPSCKINDCGNLTAPDDGSVTYSSGTTFQSVAAFVCDIGYTLDGDSTRTCQANATWSNSTPSCKINYCGNLTAPDGGSVTYSAGTTFQSVARFECDSGYTLNGDSTRICQANTSWSNRDPSCKINDCGNLIVPDDGSVTYSTGTTFQSVAMFDCGTGYTLDGDSTRTCQADSSWSNSDPSCKINDCGKLTAPADGSVTFSSGTTYQSVASFDCNTEYTLEGDATRTCQANASWSNSDPSCKINDCGNLTAPADGSVNYSSGTTYQSVATFYCSIGYTLKGDVTRTCQANESWSNSDPSCNINDCGNLIAPADGSLTYSSGTTFQSVASFACNTGYTLEGDGMRTCQANASWSNMNPSCNINDCGNLTNPADGSVTYSSWTTYQSIATFDCNTGYTLEGYAMRTCQANTSWSNSDPYCKINDCHDPIKVGYIFENVVATTYGRRVGVSSCDTGYTGTPDVTYIECLANGDWSAVSGCMVGRCNSPSKVGYIFGTPTATTYGGTVRVISCATGYTGSPAVTELTCQDTGKWSDVTGCTISDQTNTVIALAVSLSLVTAILICVIVAFLIRERKRERKPSNNAGNVLYEMPDQAAHQRPEDHYATLDVQNDGYEVPVSRRKF